MKVKYLLKILNPLIWLINIFNYFCHLEKIRIEQKNIPYDFSDDIKYF